MFNESLVVMVLANDTPVSFGLRSLKSGGSFPPIVQPYTETTTNSSVRKAGCLTRGHLVIVGLPSPAFCSRTAGSDRQRRPVVFRETCAEASLCSPGPSRQ